MQAINAVEVAAVMYDEYCESVGGVAFNGDPLPTWDEFYSDPSKEKQSRAWVASAIAVATHLSEKFNAQTT